MNTPTLFMRSVLLLSSILLLLSGTGCEMLDGEQSEPENANEDSIQYRISTWFSDLQQRIKGGEKPEDGRVVRTYTDEAGRTVYEIIGVRQSLPTNVENVLTSFSNSNVVNDIAVQGDFVWAATHGGLVRWNVADHTYVKYTAEHGLRDYKIVAVDMGPEGEVWALTRTGLLYRIDESGQIVETDLANGLLEPLNYILEAKIAVDAESAWIAQPDHRLARVYHHGAFEEADIYADALSSESNGAVFALTGNTIFRLNLDGSRDRVAQLAGVQDGWDSEGDLLLADDGTFLLALRNEGMGRIRYLRTDGAWDDFLEVDGELTGIALGEDASIYYGVRNAGLFRLRPSGIVEHFQTQDSSAPFDLAEGSEFNLAGDRMATSSNAAWMAFRNLTEFTDDGLVTVFDGTEIFGEEAVFQTADVLPDDSILTGTIEHGLAIRRAGSLEWETITIAEGLLSNIIIDIDHDDAGNAWILHPDGLSLLGANSASATVEYEADSPFLGTARIAVGQDGSLWVGDDHAEDDDDPYLFHMDDQRNMQRIPVPESFFPIQASSDGSLLAWAGDGIARLTADGQVQALSMPVNTEEIGIKRWTSSPDYVWIIYNRYVGRDATVEVARLGPDGIWQVYGWEEFSRSFGAPLDAAFTDTMIATNRDVLRLWRFDYDVLRSTGVAIVDVIRFDPKDLIRTVPAVPEVTYQTTYETPDAAVNVSTAASELGVSPTHTPVSPAIATSTSQLTFMPTPAPTDTPTTRPTATQPSPTPTSTSTPAPLAASTETATDDESPAEETPAPTALAAPDSARVLTAILNVRSGPSTVFEVVVQVQEDESLQVLGRNIDGTWIQVSLPDGQSGWLSTAYVELGATVDNLPVIHAPDAPQGCAITTHPDLQAVWNRSTMGCPIGPAGATWAAWQPFQRGQMLWRKDTGDILVFVSGAGWAAHEDRWTGSVLTNYRGSAPTGLQAPVRGFGYLWENQEPVFDDIGWAFDKEKGFCLLVQEYEHVSLLTSRSKAPCNENLYDHGRESGFGFKYMLAWRDGRWSN